MASGFWQPIAIAIGDGPTLTAAAAATCLPVTAKYTFAPNSIGVQSVIRVRATGRISCIVTTPGTARFDLRLGGTVIYDSGALNLNVVAKTNVPWWLEVDCVCRAAGTSGNFMSFGDWTSEAVVASALGSAGGAGELVSAGSSGPSAAPVVSGAVDLTVAAAFDFFFTQTQATGSFTVHNFVAETGSLAMA